MKLEPKRIERIRKVSCLRQQDLTVVLENVHDPHNIGAVMRTCDSVGIHQVHVIYTEDRLGENNLKLGKRSSAGTRKWVDVLVYRSIEECLDHLKPKFKFYGAYVSPASPSLYDLELTQPAALVFGNEHDGISEQMLEKLDGTFFIPQVGMVRSLNISVACAISLYEAYRQRLAHGKYIDDGTPGDVALYKDYLERSTNKFYGLEGQEVK